ncbi:MAG: toxin-antitoxin system HicB family antitoxin [Magnetococcales bacterium]|nr:toxin-antitoxin system HicB family antitoxin [Magnetococcales bacterium]
MGTLTIRIPDAKHQRLKELARQQNVSLDKLIDELSTVALTQFDAEIRFQTMAARGSVTKGLTILDRMDQAFLQKQVD